MMLSGTIPVKIEREETHRSFMQPPRRAAALGFLATMRKKGKFVPISAVVSGMNEGHLADQELSTLAGRRREGFALAGVPLRPCHQNRANHNAARVDAAG
jgi:hypothetical protein